MAEEVPRYRRVLLKLSGEALMGPAAYGIDPSVLATIAQEIASLRRLKVETAIVIGGGNIFRGLAGVAQGFDRVRADQMGMLATVLNAIALGEALQKHGVPTKVLSAYEIRGVVEGFGREKALSYLEGGYFLVLAAGTGNPFFTTDTAAVLRALEIKAEVVFKATKVDGVYNADPVKDPSAKKYDFLTYEEVLEKDLRVMDLTAITLARDNNLPVMVFNMQEPGNILKAVSGQKVGTLVGGGA
ncbi:UMP kinase [Thermodesulfatator autotrophicus]|uniref:Uridylate kinase n=1 Tax=Thermodesulfatator autotrophicus TaxID=1795632 RepID=A0A177E5S9_9BACT|nr:UMP kinase [Thermodesulfatator autotrophicus]OAG27138.1 UMP kinase [Thermodesulfatator autotrophicus]